MFVAGNILKQLIPPDFTSGEDLAPYATYLSGRDLYKRFNELNYEQQARIIEFYYDAKFLKYARPERKHHKMSLKLERHVLFALKGFIENPNDTSLLPVR